MEFVGRMVDEHGLSGKVLEVGSCNYNGTVRGFFRGSDYVGVDAQQGPDVDLVCEAKDLAKHFKRGSFDVVVSTEMLEHDPRPWLSIPVMASMLKVGGKIVLTTRGPGFHYHEYPGDYWRFTQDSIRLLFDDAGLLILDIEDDPYPEHPGVFVVAQRPGRKK